MRRLDSRNLALLAVFVPAFAVVFALHVQQAFTRALAEPGFYVSNPKAPDLYPRVGGFRREQAGGAEAIRIGDRMLRVGSVDLRGVGHIGYDAIAIREAGPDGRFEVQLERDGVVHSAVASLARSPVPWVRIPVLLSTAFLAIAVLLGAPASSHPRLFFVAAMTMLLEQTPFHGGSLEQTIASKTIHYVLVAIAPALVVRWAVGFPPEAPPPARLARTLPWLLIPLFAFLRANYFLGGPLPGEWAPVASLVADGLAVVVTLAVLTRNYRRSDPIGRRRVKWVIYGGYVGILPLAFVIIFLSGMLEPHAYSRAFALSVLPTVVVPLGILIAVVRQQLFDVDRLISATASYTAIGIVLVGSALTLIPRLAEAASQALGFDLALGQGFLTLVLAAVVVPAHRHVQPRIDRFFFPERYSLEMGMQRLLTELSDCEGPEELSGRIGEQLAALLRPESCVIYTRAETSFVPVFIQGRNAAAELDRQGPLVAVLSLRKEPVVGQPMAGGSSRLKLPPFERAVLEELGVAVVAPVRVGDELAALVALGPKRSGDVYTATDVAWISTVTERMAAELQRFDAERLIERGRELQEAFRRYVPGAVAEQIETGAALEAGEREVTVLFVDIRGYTRFTEGSQPLEIFSTVNRYTQLVSRVVRDNGGTVVEFNGDGMMAVFGAPRALEQMERAAVITATEILAGLDDCFTADDEQIAVGIGAATGPAVVGSIQAADRLIWSALGNTTNLAARLQALTRDLDVAAVIDEATWRAAGPLQSSFERRAGVRIRGLDEPRDVFVTGLF
jgi:class 3 adenylate cyclase